MSSNEAFVATENLSWNRVMEIITHLLEDKHGVQRPLNSI